MVRTSFTDQVELLRGAHSHRIPLDELRDKLSAILRPVATAAIPRSEHQIWFRAVRCETEEAFSTLRRCIYPPAERADYGRCNLKHQPAFYAGWNIPTSLVELSAQEGELFQVIAVRPRPGIELRCAVVGAFEHYHFSGRAGLGDPWFDKTVHDQLALLSPEAQALSIYVDSFLSEEFRRPGKHPLNYKLTATYATHFAPQGGGVIYPSVETRSGYNLSVAVPVFDSFFEVVEVYVLRVRASLGFGVLDLEELRRSSKFSKDGTIEWGASTIEKREFHPSFGLRVIAPGAWRVPDA